MLLVDNAPFPGISTVRVGHLGLELWVHTGWFTLIPQKVPIGKASRAVIRSYTLAFCANGGSLPDCRMSRFFYLLTLSPFFGKAWILSDPRKTARQEKTKKKLHHPKFCNDPRNSCAFFFTI